MTPTCGSCAYWGAGHEQNSESPAWRRVRPCGAVKHDDSDSYRADGSLSTPLSDPNAKAEVVDGSGYFAALRTRADFGCVLYQEVP